MTRVHDDTRAAAKDDPEPPGEADPDTTFARPGVDETSEWSFPASDPPATWNWEPRAS